MASTYFLSNDILAYLALEHADNHDLNSLTRVCHHTHDIVEPILWKNFGATIYRLFLALPPPTWTYTDTAMREADCQQRACTICPLFTGRVLNPEAISNFSTPVEYRLRALALSVMRLNIQRCILVEQLFEPLAKDLGGIKGLSFAPASIVVDAFAPHIFDMCVLDRCTTLELGFHAHVNGLDDKLQSQYHPDLHLHYNDSSFDLLVSNPGRWTNITNVSIQDAEDEIFMPLAAIPRLQKLTLAANGPYFIVGSDSTYILTLSTIPSIPFPSLTSIYLSGAPYALVEALAYLSAPLATTVSLSFNNTVSVVLLEYIFSRLSTFPLSSLKLEWRIDYFEKAEWNAIGVLDDGMCTPLLSFMGLEEFFLSWPTFPSVVTDHFLQLLQGNSPGLTINNFRGLQGQSGPSDDEEEEDDEENTDTDSNE